MRSFIVFSLSIFLSLQIAAQITITDGDMASVNDTFRVSVTANMQGYDPALTGANYTWSFDTLQADFQRVDTFLSVSSTPNVYNFVFFGASYAQVGPTPSNTSSQFSFEDVYNFFDNSTSSYEQMGFGAKVNGNPIPVKYSQYDRIYKFPLNYNDTDSSFAEYGFSVPNYGYYGQEITRIDTTDGYGSLTTPFGTFQTLRVKSTVYREDTIYYDSLGFGTTFTRPVEIEYKWLAANEGIPILSVTERNATYNVVYRDSMRDVYQVSTPKLGSNEFDGMKVYPNPASNKVYVKLTTPSNGNYQLRLLDITGKEILQKEIWVSGNPRSKRFSIQSQGIHPGVYLLQLQSPGGEIMVEKLQVQP